MLKGFLSRWNQWQQYLKELLLQRLECENTLVVDDAFLIDLRIDRKQFFEIAYNLAMQEYIHVVADQSGYAVLVSKKKFRHFMLRFAQGAGGDASALTSGMDSSTSELAALEDTVVIDPVDADMIFIDDILVQDSDCILVDTNSLGTEATGFAMGICPNAVLEADSVTPTACTVFIPFIAPGEVTYSEDSPVACEFFTIPA